MPRPKFKVTSKRKPQTTEEKELVKAKKQQRAAKIKLNVAQKKLAKLANGSDDTEIKERATENLPETYSKKNEANSRK